MNMFADIYARCSTGVVHLNFLKAGKRFAAGTGFMLNSRLITNNHVYYVPEADQVLIRTLRHKPNDSSDGILMSYKDNISGQI
jgi:hypothetical protein